MNLFPCLGCILIGAIAPSSSLSGKGLPPSADWTALPTPSLCEPRTAPSHPGRLASGSHILSRNEDLSGPGSPPAARLPLATLQKIIEDDVRSRGSRIEFFRSASGLLARGDPPAIEAARARISDLDRAAALLRVDVEIELTGGTPAATDRLSAKRSVLSGEETFFGQRETTAFVMSFDVEVAADSGVASPELGTATHGRTLHLRATRIAGGARVHLEGLLDVSELAKIDRFDPATPDLGVLQQPAVDFVQIAFAGVVDSGSALLVEVSGTHLSKREWKLSVRATARADDPASTRGDLDVIDLAYLSSESAALPSAGPGAELDRQAHFAPSRRGAGAIPPSAIAAALDARSGDGAATRMTPWWTDDLLILLRADAAGRAEARALVAAGEAMRLATCRVEARRGDLKVRFPACSGSPARLLAGRERTALVGYRAEIAPETWMPDPDVEKAFDGLSLAVEVLSGAAECSAWIASSSAEAVVEREDAQLGKLQLLSRSLRAEQALLPLGPEPENERTLAEAGAGSADALVLRCVAP